ncbi:MAG: hypothetical protein COA96_16245 [SAR86 cluster bacterium]|uniref:Uncharacterized protein n=1 Tax=SAR86 cluster bacterium TaxID=2030880 RepID=A0A2A5AL18_9GAMM|nr:MAG: hypothetical protein COA96_16245 [SAR86 cluster bacterium]
MVNLDKKTSSEKAKSALRAIDGVKDSIQRYSTQPRWFITLSTVVIFIVLVGIELKGPNGLAPLIILVFVRLYMERTQGLVPLLSDKGQWIANWYLFLMVGFYLIIVYLYRVQQLSWAPLVGGTVAATIYVIRAEATRAKKHSENSDNSSR